MPRMLNRLILRGPLLIASVVLISSCKTLSPITTPPSAPIAKDWSAEKTDLSTAQPHAWLSDLNVPKLDDLVTEADAQNYFLRAALARWQAAQAQTNIVNADRKPIVSGEGNLSRNRTNSRTFNTLAASARMNWEIDAWDRLADQTRAAIRDEQAFAADYQAARLSLAASVASSWFALLEAEQQRRLAEQTTQTFQQSLDVIEERYRRGLNGALDVRLARSDLATAQNEITRRAREKEAIARQIDIFLGRYPAAELLTYTTPAEATVTSPVQSGDIHSPPDDLRPVPAGLPADLLTRRPDILAAEARLNAAGDRLRFARKNRLPRIQLSTTGGVSSDTLNQLLDWDSLVFTLLVGIVQPIYEGGRLDAQRTLAQAQHQEAWANYIQTVLVAFQEVETTLAAEDRYSQQLADLFVASQEAQAAAELAMSRYQNGLADIITLLQSQRQAFSSQSQFLLIQRQRLQNRINLYLALGGDFADTSSGTAQTISQKELITNE